MDSQLDNSSHKREHDEDNSEQNKRKKPETPEEPVVMTNLTDVIDDCLMHIFQYLMLQDLINVADTCKRFQPSAESVFISKCKGKTLNLLPGYRLVRFQRIKLIENVIRIPNFSNCLKILRLFGGLITKLHINYISPGRITRNQSNVLARYINEFCSDSLIDIEMDSATNEVTANWTKPFENAETIRLRFCSFNDLNVWFPKMQRLVIHDSSYDMIGKSVPHLKKLEIYVYGNYRLPKIHFKSVNEFRVNFLNNDLISEIPFTFDQLEKVELVCLNHISSLDGNFKRFIKENPSLTTLTVYTQTILNTDLIESIKSYWSEIEGLQIDVKQQQQIITSAPIEF